MAKNCLFYYICGQAVKRPLTGQGLTAWMRSINCGQPNAANKPRYNQTLLIPQSATCNYCNGAMISRLFIKDLFLTSTVEDFGYQSKKILGEK